MDKIKLIKYSFPRDLKLIVGIISLIIYFIIFLSYIWAHDLIDNVVVFSVLTVIVILIGLKCGFIRIYKFFEQLKKFEREGKLKTILQDFDHAESLFHDALRLGENYVFGNATGNIIDYKDIHSIHYYKHGESYLKIESLKGNFPFCKVYLDKNDDEELKKLCKVILKKNPSVKLGY